MTDHATAHPAQPGRDEGSISGVNLIGYPSAGFGLGNTLRQFGRALLAHGIAIQVLDLNPNVEPDDSYNTLRNFTVPAADALDQEVNLYILPGAGLPSVVTRPLPGLTKSGRMNVAFVWWEVPEIPAHMLAALRTFDALVAGSEYVQWALRLLIPEVPVLHAPHPLDIPTTARNSRSAFNLPEEKFIVFCGFDPGSGFDRKNPIAAIEAFRQAFPDTQHCELVVKANVHGQSRDAWHMGGERALRDAVANDNRIRVISEYLSPEQLLSLYASCDVVISLHRTEGLGLIPLEAMRIGKPVVATEWSGNLSYMNHRNSCLVTSHMVDVPVNSPNFGRRTIGLRARWVEPSIEHAANWLRSLHENKALRQRVADQALQTAEAYDSNARALHWLTELSSMRAAQKTRPARQDQALMEAALRLQRRFELRQRLTRLSLRDVPPRAYRFLKRKLGIIPSSP